MIALNSITIGHKQALFDIDQLLLEKGKMYALIGANGAGKTTFLSAITGMHLPLKGDIMVDQRSISSFNRIEKARTISFVGSKFDGIEFLKVRDYIALGRTPYTNALGRLIADDWQIVEETIDLLQLNDLKEKFTTDLSDGERQLVAIARAITQQTPVIILDEPTAFLDYANRKKVMELMKKIATELQKCIIVSSHDLELCLESQIELLVVHKKKAQLILYPPLSISKEELITIGF